MHFSTILVGASALLAPVLAQTWSDCNPTKNTTCPNDPGFGIDHTFDFKDKKAVTRSFNITNGALSYGSDGTQFVINKQGESPTIRSKFYIHFGSISVVMKAAKGQGIVSSIVIQSEDLDEIDWEFLGGNATHAQTNYFGKGDTSSYDRDIWHPVDTDVRDNFHNYTVDWTAEKMDFYIDSKKVRTLPYAAANGGKNYPQTPSTVRLGIWAGGDKDNNGKWTVIWAGGETDFKQAPFTMYVKETHVKDYGSGKEYVWSDQSGDFKSIKSVGGESAAALAIRTNADPVEQTPVTTKPGDSIKTDKSNDPSKTEDNKADEANKDASKPSGTGAAASTSSAEPAKSMTEKFNELPQTSKVAIYAGAGGGAAVIFAAFMFICIRQRRKGRAERDDYNDRIEKQREEAYRDQMELRNKGLGGWDQNTTQGEDALGGWQAKQPDPLVPKVPTVTERDLAIPSPTSPMSRVGSPAWNGGNQGGLINNAQNAYSGGYGQNRAIPSSPNFPLSQNNQSDYGFPQQGFPQQPSHGFGNHGGYSRF